MYERHPASLEVPYLGELVARFQHLIGQPGGQRRSVADYADQLCVETLKAATGQTAGQWLDELVVHEAQALLYQTGCINAQVADLLGFSDASAFGNFFRRLIGYTPATYRRQRPLESRP
ncbi:MAG: AraC family transcriptional regulator [Hymenobacter sp.]|nr:MAG: AraC family transcriptional regulator [Hymenobacter sp.]